jgi:penicillin amidase
MKFIKRTALTLLVLLVVAVVGIFVILSRSRPVTSGVWALPCLDAPVEVYFDDFGVPHIYGENAKDTYRAFGYLHAQDRLFQMELMRRVGQGTLAEVLGPKLTKTDAFFRTLGTHRKAAEDAAMFHTLPADIQSIVFAYLDGLNAFIDEDRLPIEFALSGITPQPYTPTDVYAISAYMAYSFAYALRTDPIVEYMTSHLDSVYLADFDLADAGHGSSHVPGDSVYLSQVLANIPGYQLLDNLPVPSLQGSNAWAIAPKRSASGQTMLSNDTHIKYGSPSVWYEAHINYPGFELYGNYMAAIPFALVGHSRQHGWGVTMFEDDDSDFFIQRFATIDSSATFFGESQAMPVTKYIERIVVKGAPDSIITVYETENGVLINSFLPAPTDIPVAMYWNYTCIGNELLEAFHALNYAGDMVAFEQGASLIGSPGLNLTYVDLEGNIASWSCSKLINRAPHTKGKAYLKGYAPEDAYHGMYGFDQNPKLVNPASGYIASANQYHDESEGLAYPGYYAPNNRYDRISSMIEQTGLADMADMERWITDVVSPVESAVAQNFAEILTNADVAFTALELECIDAMLGWEGGHHLESIEPTIYYTCLFHVLQASLHDELGATYFESLLSTHLLLRSYPKLIANEASPWWNDIHTDEHNESREEILVAALRASVRKLSDVLGEDMEVWHWKRVHTTEHQHPLGTVAFLKPFFNVGPFATVGGNETVNNAGFEFNGDAKFESRFGPAMRILIDFAAVEDARSVLPTGNSGNVLSPHYKDQTGLYNAGEFRPMLMDSAEIKISKNRLVLRKEL